MPNSRLVNRNVVAGHGRTSMRLEPEFWEALAEMCRREEVSTFSEMVRRLKMGQDGAKLTSAVRIAILAYYRSAAAATWHVDDAGSGRGTPHSPASASPVRRAGFRRSSADGSAAAMSRGGAQPEPASTGSSRGS